MKKFQKYRLLLSVCLFCAFCFSGSMTAVSAAENTQEADITVLVTAIHNESELSSLPEITLPLRTSQSNDNLEKVYLLALNYQTVSATVTEDGKSREETLAVAWDFSSINQTKEGEYAAVGSITLPSGYAFDENVLRELKIPVLVKEMPPAVITSVESWYPYTNAFAVLQDSSMEALTEMFSSSPYYLECYTEDNDGYTAEVEWDFSGVDLHTVGLYSAKGSLSAPEDTVFAEELLLPEISIPISVQASGKPDINCLIAARGSLLFPWVTPPGSLEEISVWLSEDNGSWQCLADGVYAGSEMLSLSTYLLTYGSTYRLQADYDGGQTGILSFTYADEIVLTGYHDGDRDGGDAGGNPAAETTQPAPKAPESGSGKTSSADTAPSQSTDSSAADNGQTASVSSDGAHSAGKNAAAASASAGKEEHGSSLTPSEGRIPPAKAAASAPAKGEASEDTDVSEFFGETTDRISGTRLLLMLQTGNQRAVFSKQRITISIPQNALPENIQESDQIEITIKQEADGGFSFLFSINGKAIDFLPGVLVMIPYPSMQAADVLYLLDETAAEFPMTSYDSASQTASFFISHTGVYHTLVKNDSAVISDIAAPEKDRQPIVLFLLPVCLLLLPVGAFFIRRRQK